MFNKNYNYKIYTTKNGIYIADCIKYMLDKMNYNTTIVFCISKEDIKNNNNNPNEIYILLFCQTLKNIPLKNKYIIYQLEQVKQSNWLILSLYKYSIYLTKSSLDILTFNESIYMNILANHRIVHIISLSFFIFSKKYIEMNIISINNINLKGTVI